MFGSSLLLLLLLLLLILMLMLTQYEAKRRRRRRGPCDFSTADGCSHVKLYKNLRRIRRRWSCRVVSPCSSSSSSHSGAIAARQSF
jgi:hypothetical protein